MDLKKEKVIMFITVGMGRNREDIASAIVKSISDHNPDQIVFFCTSESEQKTLPIVKEKMTKKGIQLEEAEVVILESEDDFELIKEKCSEVIKSKKGRKFIDYTPGTKAMSVGLVFAGIENGVEKISYITGKRDEGGRVIPGSERILSFEPTKIYATMFFNKAIEYFNDGRFESAKKLVEGYLKVYHDESFRSKAMVFVKLCDVYFYWDLFEHRKAFEIAKEIENSEILTSFGIKSRFEANREVLHFLSKEDFSYAKAVDLLRNAERRINSGRYDDAVARLYRLIEYVVQLLISRRGIYSEPGKIDLSKLPENLRDKYRSEEIPLAKSAELLKDLGDEFGAKIYDAIESGELKKILTVRNNSILAHGFTPVDAETAKKFFNILVDILKEYPEGKFDRIYEMTKFPQISFRF